MVTTATNMEPNYNKVKRKESRQKMIFQEAKKEYIPHPLEASLEESERGYKIFGEYVSSL